MSRATPAYPLRPTVVEVAHAANVAVGTVSRVLNTPEMVGPEIRQRVLDAIEEMHYTPLRRRRKNGAANDPGGSRQRGNVGLLLIGIDETLSNLPMVSEALHGVEMATAPDGLNLMLANVPKADRVPACLAKSQVDGLIIKSPLLGDLRTCASPALVSAINRLPHVWLLGRPESAEGDLCGADFDSGARIVLEYLRALGHRRAAYLDPWPGLIHSESLKCAVDMQAERLGLQVRHIERHPAAPVKWPLPAGIEDEKIVSLLDRWEGLSTAQRPSALIVASDSVAVPIFHALRQRGWVVGRDVSVLSMNHERTLAMGLSPALTTLDLRAEAIGRRAVEQLLWRLRDHDDGVGTKILVEPRLIAGASVAQVRIAA